MSFFMLIIPMERKHISSRQVREICENYECVVLGEAGTVSYSYTYPTIVSSIRTVGCTSPPTNKVPVRPEGTGVRGGLSEMWEPWCPNLKKSVRTKPVPVLVTHTDANMRSLGLTQSIGLTLDRANVIAPAHATARAMP